jgi:hypothetical protein
MAKVTPLQQALDALDRDLPRSGLSKAAQLEYDRIKPVWEDGTPAEVQQLRGQAEYPFPSHGVQRLKARWQARDWKGRIQDIALALAILIVVVNVLAALVVAVFHPSIGWLDWFDCRKHPEMCNSP